MDMRPYMSAGLKEVNSEEQREDQSQGFSMSTIKNQAAVNTSSHD